jgi:ribosomal protein S18 acetylase RimI-like enzyme
MREQLVDPLPHRWETPRLTVQDSALHDVPELQQINDHLPSIEGWTGAQTKDGTGDSLLAALAQGVLPPDGSPALFRLQSLQLRHTGQLAGFLGAYHGFPTPDTLWITVLAIDPPFQGQGLGQEVLCGLSDMLGHLGTFSRMRLCVSLKNWPALRFWTQAGFRTIVEVAGDKVHSDTASGHLILEKPVARP